MAGDNDNDWDSKAMDNSDNNRGWQHSTTMTTTMTTTTAAWLHNTPFTMPHPHYKREVVGLFFFFFLIFFSLLLATLHRCEQLLAGCGCV
jgi:hypothetical protein